MSIGTRYTNFGFFNGIIDDIRVYNLALSAGEVLSLFNNATASDTTPPTVSAQLVRPVMPDHSHI